jgi:hypothetical protein
LPINLSRHPDTTAKNFPLKKSLEENRKIQTPPRRAARPDGSQIEQNQFLDDERHAKLQLGGFAAKVVVWIATPLTCVGIWILLDLFVRWFFATSPFPLT